MASPASLLVREPAHRIALISSRESDNLELSQIFHLSQSRVYSFAMRITAVEFLRKNNVGIVVCSVELPDGGWKDVLDALSHLEAPPQLIVSSHLADERLWAEVLNLGCYDLLLTPFEAGEVLRVISGAWRAWEATLKKTALSRTAAISSQDLRTPVN